MLGMSIFTAFPYIFTVSYLLVLTSVVVAFVKIVGASPFTWHTCIAVGGVFGTMGVMGLYLCYMVVLGV